MTLVKHLTWLLSTPSSVSTFSFLRSAPPTKLCRLPGKVPAFRRCPRFLMVSILQGLPLNISPTLWYATVRRLGSQVLRCQACPALPWAISAVDRTRSNVGTLCASLLPLYVRAFRQKFLRTSSRKKGNRAHKREKERCSLLLHIMYKTR